MASQTVFTAFLNDHFGTLAVRILHAAHLQPYDARAPITNAFAIEILVAMLLLLFFVAVRVSLNVEEPGAIQQAAEWVHGFVSDQAELAIDHNSQRYVAFCTCVLIFILVCNLIGLIPGLVTPTAKPTVPLGLAILCFLYYNYQGMREVGIFGHGKHFLGPVWWLAPLMLPTEIFSHLARMLSLSVRLYANMFAGEMVMLVFFSFVPIGLPILFLGLHLGVAVLQAYIFMLLTMVYVSQAVVHEH